MAVKARGCRPFDRTLTYGIAKRFGGETGPDRRRRLLGRPAIDRLQARLVRPHGRAEA